jgi:hypothetical protein
MVSTWNLMLNVKGEPSWNFLALRLKSFQTFALCVIFTSFSRGLFRGKVFKIADNLKINDFSPLL